MKHTVIILNLLMATLSFSLVDDYMPLAIGNEWRFSGDLGEKVLRVVDIDSNWVSILDSTRTKSGSKDSIAKYVSDDSTGAVYNIPFTYEFRGRSFHHYLILAKHFFFPVGDLILGLSTVETLPQVTVPAGNFKNAKQFHTEPRMAGRPHLVHPKNIVASGFGLITMQLRYLMDYERPKIWKLTKASLKPVPMGYGHSVKKSDGGPAGDSVFSFTQLDKDSGVIGFRLKMGEKNQIITSFYPGRQCLRIYVADLAAAKSSYDHNLSVKNLRAYKSIQVKVFLQEEKVVAHQKFGGPNHLVYNERVEMGSTGIQASTRSYAFNRHITLSHHGNNITLRLPNPMETIAPHTLGIHNLKGSLIRRLSADKHAAEIIWDGRDSRGILAPWGNYIGKIQAAP